jgi:hypothetical protein
MDISISYLSQDKMVTVHPYSLKRSAMGFWKCRPNLLRLVLSLKTKSIWFCGWLTVSKTLPHTLYPTEVANHFWLGCHSYPHDLSFYLLDCFGECLDAYQNLRINDQINDKVSINYFFIIIHKHIHIGEHHLWSADQPWIIQIWEK